MCKASVQSGRARRAGRRAHWHAGEQRGGLHARVQRWAPLHPHPHAHASHHRCPLHTHLTPTRMGTNADARLPCTNTVTTVHARPLHTRLAPPPPGARSLLTSSAICTLTSHSLQSPLHTHPPHPLLTSRALHTCPLAHSPPFAHSPPRTFTSHWHQFHTHPLARSLLFTTTLCTLTPHHRSPLN